MANGNGEAVTRRKDVGMKLIYAVLSILISAFVALTFGVAKDANEQTHENKTEIAVIKKEVSGNQNLIIEKMNGISTQQTMMFNRIDEKIGDIKEQINIRHP